MTSRSASGPRFGETRKRPSRSRHFLPMRGRLTNERIKYAKPWTFYPYPVDVHKLWKPPIMDMAELTNSGCPPEVILANEKGNYHKCRLPRHPDSTRRSGESMRAVPFGVARNIRSARRSCRFPGGGGRRSPWLRASAAELPRVGGRQRGGLRRDARRGFAWRKRNWSRAVACVQMARRHRRDKRVTSRDRTFHSLMT
jgi:hypothetical protein